MEYIIGVINNLDNLKAFFALLAFLVYKNKSEKK